MLEKNENIFKNEILLIGVKSFEDLKNKFELNKESLKNSHLLFIFESFRFSLCFIFPKNSNHQFEDFENKLEENEDNQTSCILTLFKYIYESEHEIIEQDEDLKNINIDELFSELEKKNNKNQIQEILEYLKKADEKFKFKYQMNNQPEFIVSSMFGCLINNLILKLLEKGNEIDFDLLIFNSNEILDRSKDLGTSRNIKLFK